MSRVRRNTDSNKKIWIVVFVAVSVFCIVFFAARGRYTAPLGERVAVTVLAPLQNIAAQIGSQLHAATAGIWEFVTVYEQNKMLMSEVEQLRALNLQSQELASENERLRALLDYKKAAKQFDLVAATVVARDAVTWTNRIVINRGTNDGIAKDMAVVTSQGIVGNVAEVYGSYAQVELITDLRSAVGTIVQRAGSRVAGIVEGNPGDKAFVRMVNIPKDADIIVGDEIVTSGFGGVYPKGIPVGTVERIENDEGGLLKYAILKPAVDFQRLEDVAIIVNSREPLPEPITKPANATANGMPNGGKAAGAVK